MEVTPLSFLLVAEPLVLKGHKEKLAQLVHRVFKVKQVLLGMMV